MSEEGQRTQPLIETNTEMLTEGPEKGSSDYRLASRSPFMTVFIMSFGPFMAELGAACYSLIDAFWIGKVCGQNGLAAMSLSGLLECLGRAFGMFLSVAASSQLAKLRGERNSKELSRVFADLFRLCFIFGAVCSGILLPCIVPMLKFFGAEGDIMRLGSDYLFAVLGGSVVSCLNLFLCGVLQSEGRSFVYGAVQVSSCLLNGLLFDPLFMLVFKMETLGAGLATVCAEALPMLVVAVLFFCGKFEMKVGCAELMGKPSLQSWEALKIGFTQFISHLCLYLPTFFSRKYVVGCAEASGRYSEVLAAFNVCARLWNLPACYTIAVSIGLLPSASYAMGAGLYKRVKVLFGWSLVLTFIWCSAIEAILMLLGRNVAILFGNEDSFLELTAKMLRVSFMFSFSMGSQYVVQTLLQAIRQNLQAMIFSMLTQLLPVPVFGAILYFASDDKDILRVIAMFSCNDAFSLLVSIIFAIWPLWKLRKLDSEQRDLLTTPSESDEL